MIRSFITCLNEQNINKLELPILDFDLLEDENNE